MEAAKTQFELDQRVAVAVKQPGNKNMGELAKACGTTTQDVASSLNRLRQSGKIS